MKTKALESPANAVSRLGQSATTHVQSTEISLSLFLAGILLIAASFLSLWCTQKLPEILAPLFAPALICIGGIAGLLGHLTRKTLLDNPEDFGNTVFAGGLYGFVAILIADTVTNLIIFQVEDSPNQPIAYALTAAAGLLAPSFGAAFFSGNRAIHRDLFVGRQFISLIGIVAGAVGKRVYSETSITFEYLFPVILAAIVASICLELVPVWGYLFWDPTKSPGRSNSDERVGSGAGRPANIPAVVPVIAFGPSEISSCGNTGTPTAVEPAPTDADSTAPPVVLLEPEDNGWAGLAVVFAIIGALLSFVGFISFDQQITAWAAGSFVLGGIIAHILVAGKTGADGACSSLRFRDGPRVVVGSLLVPSSILLMVTFMEQVTTRGFSLADLKGQRVSLGLLFAAFGIAIPKIVGLIMGNVVSLQRSTVEQRVGYGFLLATVAAFISMAGGHFKDFSKDLSHILCFVCILFVTGCIAEYSSRSIPAYGLEHLKSKETRWRYLVWPITYTAAVVFVPPIVVTMFTAAKAAAVELTPWAIPTAMIIALLWVSSQKSNRPDDGTDNPSYPSPSEPSSLRPIDLYSPPPVEPYHPGGE